MSLYQKLVKNWECGLFTMLKDEGDDTFMLVTIKNSSSRLNASSWQDSEQEAINELCGIDISQANVDGWSGVTIHRTIHPLELMGGGYKVGDKVRIKRNAREELAKTESVIYLPRNVTDIIARGWGLISWSNGISSPKVEEWLFPLTCLEPWFEDEIPQDKIDEAMAILTKAGKIKDRKVIV